jgi:hypothetical protein
VETGHFEAAFSEIFVAKAFDYGVARHTFEEYHTNPRYVDELEFAYRRGLARRYPREREGYLGGLPG